MQINIGAPILIGPTEKITFTVSRKKDPPCKAAFLMNGWQDCDQIAQPDPKTRLKTCIAPQTIGSKCDATVTVDFRKDEQGTFDPEEEYDVTIQGETGHSVVVPFFPPPVINGQTFHFQVSKS